MDAEGFDDEETNILESYIASDETALLLAPITSCFTCFTKKSQIETFQYGVAECRNLAASLAFLLTHAFRRWLSNFEGRDTDELFPMTISRSLLVPYESD